MNAETARGVLPMPPPGSRQHDETSRQARQRALRLGRLPGRYLDWDTDAWPHALLACACDCGQRAVVPAVVATALSGGWLVRLLTDNASGPEALNGLAERSGHGSNLEVSEIADPRSVEHAAQRMHDELEARLERRYSGVAIDPRPMLVVITGSGPELGDGHLAAMLLRLTALGRSVAIHVLVASVGPVTGWLLDQLSFLVAHELTELDASVVLGRRPPTGVGTRLSWAIAGDGAPRPVRLYTTQSVRRDR